MILLDTNVLSEFAKPEPNPRVLSWMASVGENELRISAVTVMEMLTGANRMQDGRPSERKAEVILEVLGYFHARTLSFGPVAAAECATIRSLRAAAGRPIALADAMIAATAIAAEADAVATRDKDFAGTGIRVVNPWAA
ncbi:MAG: PIN domain-containing protein [Leifsonia sp.]